MAKGHQAASQPQQKRVTMEDVAQRAQVSIATVSRYVSGQSIRSSAAVQQAIDELRFRPGKSLAGSRRPRFRTVALISPDLTNPFFTSVMRGAEQVARRAGYRVAMHSIENQLGREQAVDELLELSSRVDGMLLSPFLEFSDVVRHLVAAEVPLVLLGDDPDGLPADRVVVDHVEGVRQAIHYLVHLGHRRIGALLGTRDVSTGRLRHEGFVAAMAESGLNVEPGYEVSEEHGRRSGYNGILKLMALKEPPTAVFIGGNMLALGAVRATRDLAIDVPRKLSLLSFGDVELFDLLQPSVTVIDRPTEEQGRVAMTHLLDQLADPGSAPRRTVLPTRLVVRGSCTGPSR